MKKVICLLMLIMFIPSIVLANRASSDNNSRQESSIMGYDAFVANKNGAKEIYSDEVIPYNTKVFVYEDSENIAYVRWEDKNNHVINISDITPCEEEYIPDEKDINNKIVDDIYLAKLQKEEYKIIIYEKNGISLRKGPSVIYKKYAQLIPYQTELKVTYQAGKWLYIDDEKYHGWLNNELYASEYYSDIMLFDDAKIVDENNNVIFTIPKETLIKKENLYYLSDGSKFIINYNGQNGYAEVDGEDFIYGIDISSDNYNLLSLESTEITSFNGNVRTIVNSGTTFDKAYEAYVKRDNMYFDSYYVQYGEAKGYVKTENVFKYDVGESIRLVEDKEFYSIDLYKHLINNGKSVTSSNYFTKITIPKDTVLTVYKGYPIYWDGDYMEHNFYITKYNNNFGIIRLSGVDQKLMVGVDDKKNAIDDTIDIKILILVVIVILILLIIKFIKKKKIINSNEDKKVEEKIIDKKNATIK